MVSRPRLVHELVGDYIVTALECLGNFSPISDEKVSHFMLIRPNSTECLGYRVGEVIS